MTLTKRVRLLLCVLCACAACAIVYAYDPSRTPWMPQCLMHTLTGYRCPTCGATRAAHELMHGRAYEALMLNPVMPILIVLAGLIIYRFLAKDAGSYKATQFLVYVYIAVYCVWGVVRNIIDI